MESASQAVDLRYPIGRFEPSAVVTADERRHHIEEIAQLAGNLRAAIAGLDESQLDTPYREGGWTLRQVVHHLADSHMNSFVRFKLALTEDGPIIKPYDEAAWAGTADARTMPLDASLVLIDGLHRRWAALLNSMSDADYRRTFTHPEHGARIRLDVALAMYAWHSRHHVAHITTARKRQGF